MKRFKLFALCGIFVATAGCDELNLDENGLIGTNRIIDVKAGTLFHWEEYNSWAVCHQWLTGEADIYLLKNFENNSLAAHAGENVLADGTWNKIDDSRKDTIIYEATDADLTYTGVPPTNVNQVVDIIEVKFGEVKAWHYNGKKYRFTVSDVKDQHRNDCFIEFADQRAQDRERIFVALSVTSDQGTAQLKMRSSVCGWNYRDGNANENIAYLKEFLKKAITSGMNPTYFQQEFPRAFSEGTLIQKPALSIYPALTYGYLNHRQDDKKLYKFIFIITDQK